MKGKDSVCVMGWADGFIDRGFQACTGRPQAKMEWRGVAAGVESTDRDQTRIVAS